MIANGREEASWRFVVMCLDWMPDSIGGNWGAIFELQLLLCALGYSHKEAWRLTWLQVEETR